MSKWVNYPFNTWEQKHSWQRETERHSEETGAPPAVSTHNEAQGGTCNYFFSSGTHANDTLHNLFNHLKSCVHSHFANSKAQSTSHEWHVSYLSHCASMKTWQGWDRTGWAVPAGQMAAVSCCDLWPLLRGSHQILRSPMGWYSSPKPVRDTECTITYPNRCKI